MIKFLLTVANNGSIIPFYHYTDLVYLYIFHCSLYLFVIVFGCLSVCKFACKFVCKFVCLSVPE